MQSRKLRTSFIIPTNRHEVDWLISDLRHDFPRAKFVIVDDGKGIRKEKGLGITIIRHETNQGLAISLLDGYKKAVSTKSDYIVRVDADKEYPLTPIRSLIPLLEKSDQYSGAYVETKRSFETSGVVDGLFHTIFGYIEGLVLLNHPMHQHSPGLHIYKVNTVRNFLPKLKPFVEKNHLRWGLDLVTLTLAQESGQILQHTAKNPNWKERRSILKIISQAKHATKIMAVIRKHNFNEGLSIDPEPSF